jgi:hypothetical protein
VTNTGEDAIGRDGGESDDMSVGLACARVESVDVIDEPTADAASDDMSVEPAPIGRACMSDDMSVAVEPRGRGKDVLVAIISELIVAVSGTLCRLSSENSPHQSSSRT